MLDLWPHKKKTLRGGLYFENPTMAESDKQKTGCSCNSDGKRTVLERVCRPNHEATPVPEFDTTSCPKNVQ